MFRRLLVMCFAAGFMAVLLTAFVPATALAGGITYDGSTTIGENIMPEAVKAFEEKTKIKFESIGGLGSGKGFKLLMDGKVSLAGVSRALTAEEKKLKPYYQIIGYDAVAVFVNEKNPIKELSKEQLKGIFTGKITNWKEVGGNDAKITVVTEIKTGDRATIKEFKAAALDGAEFCPSIEIDKPHDCVKYISTNENSIAHASLAFKEPGTKTVLLNKIEPSPKNVRSGAYLLSRPLLLVSKELAKGDLKKFFDYIISPEGQSIVAKNFVPLR